MFRPTRRNILAAAPAALWSAAGLAAQSAGGKLPLVISSGTGLRATKKAMDMLQSGADTLDAVIAGVAINEDDPEDSSVGYGGLPNEEGVVELDASVMHGPTRRAGSVAALRNIKNPAQVARVVMERTGHVMLVGEGALRFALAHGFKSQDLLTEKSRLAWLTWKESMSDKDFWGPGLAAPDAPPKSSAVRDTDLGPEVVAWAREVAAHPPTGTITCLAINAKGEISGTTTTSGMAWKIPGRTGDSPIIGAGLFVENDVGAAGSTGVGEENIKISGAHTVVEQMRRGTPPVEACLEALRRVVSNYFNNRKKLEKLDLNFYALNKKGEYGGAALWETDPRGNRSKMCVNDGGASRQVDCAGLLKR